MVEGSVWLSNIEFSYRSVVSSGRRVSLLMKAPGEITVRMPAETEMDIESLLTEHTRWLVARHREMLRWSAQRPLLEADGWLWVMGSRHPIGDILDVSRIVGGDELARELTAWYRGVCVGEFGRRLDNWSQQLDIPYTKLVVSNASTRWGYCRTDGLIGMSWRLYQAPGWVIDYVVVHELVHRRQPNHQKLFWQMVNQAYPEAADARRWLSDMGPSLIW